MSRTRILNARISARVGVVLPSWARSSSGAARRTDLPTSPETLARDLAGLPAEIRAHILAYAANPATTCEDFECGAKSLVSQCVHPKDGGCGDVRSTVFATVTLPAVEEERARVGQLMYSVNSDIGSYSNITPDSTSTAAPYVDPNTGVLLDPNTGLPLADPNAPPPYVEPEPRLGYSMPTYTEQAYVEPLGYNMPAYTEQATYVEPAPQLGYNMPATYEQQARVEPAPQLGYNQNTGSYTYLAANDALVDPSGAEMNLRPNPYTKLSEAPSRPSSYTMPQEEPATQYVAPSNVYVAPPDSFSAYDTPATQYIEPTTRYLAPSNEGVAPPDSYSAYDVSATQYIEPSTPPDSYSAPSTQYMLPPDSATQPPDSFTTQSPPTTSRAQAPAPPQSTADSSAPAANAAPAPPAGRGAPARATGPLPSFKCSPMPLDHQTGMARDARVDPWCYTCAARRLHIMSCEKTLGHGARIVAAANVLR